PIHIQLTAHRVKTAEESTPILKLLDRHSPESQIGHSRAVRFERRVCGAQKASLSRVGPGHVAAAGGQAHEWWDRWIDGALRARGECADAGPAAHRRHIARRPAGHALNRVVASACAYD